MHINKDEPLKMNRHNLNAMTGSRYTLSTVLKSVFIIGDESRRTFFREFRTLQEMVRTLRQIRKIVVAVVGFTLLLIGIVMIVLPGPAIVVIPLALAILGTEFMWARTLLEKVKRKIRMGSGQRRD